MGTAWFKRVLIVAVIGGMAAPALAQNCLDDAQRRYDNRRLSEAIFLLEDCKSQGWPSLDTRQKTTALRLLAISYFATREPESARESVRLLLREDDDYEANPDEDPLFFQAWVDELRPKAWHQKWWVRIGGGAVLGGVLVFALTGGKKTQPLPGPGDFFPPSGN